MSIKTTKEEIDLLLREVRDAHEQKHENEEECSCGNFINAISDSIVFNQMLLTTLADYVDDRDLVSMLIFVFHMGAEVGQLLKHPDLVESRK